ncbi:hypothetical protein CN272_28280 [Bacillus anthracis]|nr:hypothetical protein CN272_28280 [Bacillus anthracis]
MLFTSTEEAKPPTILAAEAGYNLKQKRPLTGRFFYALASARIYPVQYPSKYISDFSNISTITPIISAIIFIYRRFDTTYRLTDNSRQSYSPYIPSRPIPSNNKTKKLSHARDSFLLYICS